MTKGLQESLNENKEKSKKCTNCKAEFFPSLTATIKDMCHPCIMANL